MYYNISIHLHMFLSNIQDALELLHSRKMVNMFENELNISNLT